MKGLLIIGIGEGMIMTMVTWADMIMHIEEEGEEGNIDVDMIGNMGVDITIMDVDFEKDVIDRSKVIEKGA